MCEEDAPLRRWGGCPADLKTFDVDKYTVQQGFAHRVSRVGDTPEAVGHSAKDVVGVYHDSAECTENGTPERPSLSVLPTRSEPTSDTRFPHGAEPSAVPKENLLKILITCVLSPDCFYGQDVSIQGRRTVTSAEPYGPVHKAICLADRNRSRAVVCSPRTTSAVR